jgi:hypothetical protein
MVLHQRVHVGRRGHAGQPVVAVLQVNDLKSILWFSFDHVNVIFEQK